MLPVVHLVGESGQGKTTLAEFLICALQALGVRVAVAKHCCHQLAPGPAGKDDQRFFAAGAVAVVLAAPGHWSSCVQRGEAGPVELVQSVSPRDADMVILEGFKGGSPYPKVRVSRDEDTGTVRFLPDPAAFPEYQEEAPVRLSDEEAGRLAEVIRKRLLAPTGAGPRVMVRLDGHALPMNPLVERLITGVLQGLLGTLKGGEDFRTAEITVVSEGERVKG